MPLIKCPDCFRDISDAAPSCPNCGRPQSALTVEQTAKDFKAAQAIGGLIIFLGILALCLGNTAICLWAFAIGAAIGLYGYIGAWWHHA